MRQHRALAHALRLDAVLVLLAEREALICGWKERVDLEVDRKVSRRHALADHAVPAAYRGALDPVVSRDWINRVNLDYVCEFTLAGFV